MRIEASAGAVVVGAAVSAVAINAAAALMATRPNLQRALFRVHDDRLRSPSDAGLAFETIEYGPKRRAWFVPASSPRGAVVLVHGFVLSPTPAAASPDPMIEVAAVLHAHGFHLLIPNLGYATGAHPFSGGDAEADDVSAAARWLRSRIDGPIVAFGFSAGGHAAVLAGSRSEDITAVITDSAYDDAAGVVVEQCARTTRLPARLFGLVPWLLPLFAGTPPQRLSRALTGSVRRPRSLHIHGDADQAIPSGNLGIIAAATLGDQWLVPGSDHVGAFRDCPDDYAGRVLAFIESVRATPEDTSAVTSPSGRSAAS